MMKYILNLLLYSPIWLIFSLFSFSAVAQSTGDAAIGLRPSYAQCADHKDDEASPALFECTSAEYKYQDNRLNQVYKRLMTLLDKAGRVQLRQEELAWLAINKTYCSPNLTSNQIALLKSKNCYVYETAKRAAELEYFERYLAKQDTR